jgi:hypothetical protein
MITSEALTTTRQIESYLDQIADPNFDSASTPSVIGHPDEPGFIAVLFRAEAVARATAAVYLQEAERLDAELRRRGARR